ncbi:MAG: NAD(P)H-quinone oxidoreductase [Pseudomonadota bacterium]
MSDTMQAIAIREAGGPDVLEPVTLPRPQPGPGELLLRVAAAGVNRPDCLQRSGRYPVPADASPLPGLEVAGLVETDPTGRFAPGTRVMALTHGGGYAGYVAVNAGHCLALPDGLDLQRAAALPETVFTVYYNVWMRCRLEAGETLLVHGGSSGIGATAIQLAKAHGATVLTTAGTEEKCEFCRSLGADLAIDYRRQDFADVIREAGHGVDVVLDMVGGDYIQRNLGLMNRDGRYAFIAFLGGPTAEVNFVDVLRRRLTLTGSTLRPQSVAEKAAIAAGVERDVLPHIAAGRLTAPIYRSFPLAEAGAAHALMESGRHHGKIVLNVDEELLPA